MSTIQFNEQVFLFLMNNPFVGNKIETHIEEGQIRVNFKVGTNEFTYIQQGVDYYLYGLGDYLGKYDVNSLVKNINDWIHRIWKYSQ